MAQTKAQPGTLRVKFIPVTDGDLVIDPMGTYTSGWDKGKHFSTSTNRVIGFKPGRAKGRDGHLVVLIREDHPKSQHMRKLRV